MKRSSLSEKEVEEKKSKTDAAGSEQSVGLSTSTSVTIDTGGVRGEEATESYGANTEDINKVEEVENEMSSLESSDENKVKLAMDTDTGSVQPNAGPLEGTDAENNGEFREEEKHDVKPPEERWQLVPTTVRQRMNYLMSTSRLADCSILVGREDTKQLFKLHTLVLASSSPEFEDMLNVSKELVFPDVEPDIFKQILEYMYLDYINLWSVEKTQALYRASVKFKLPHLCEKAVEYMMAKMSLDSIWPIFEAAIATEDQILSDECKKFFKKNITNLLKHPNFVTVHQSLIASLVKEESLGVPEADLVGGVLKWCHQKCVDQELVPNLENKRSLLHTETVQHLRFLALSKEYFVSQVAYNKSKGDEGLLTMEESYAILMNMVQLNSYPMPEGFSQSAKQRTFVDLNRLIRRIFNPLGTYSPVSTQSPRLDKLTVLPGPALTAPYGCKSFLLDLISSKDISLYGIQVPTFFPGMIGSAPKLYEESYVVSVQNSSKPNKPVLGSLNWSGKVTYNSFIDLVFKDNIRLDKNTTYTIMVYTTNPYYLNQKLCTVEEANGVRFTFKDSVNLFNKPGKQDFGFISQVIYSL